MGRKKKRYPDHKDYDMMFYLHNNGTATISELMEVMGQKNNGRGYFTNYHRKFMDANYVKRYTVIPRYDRYGYETAFQFFLRVESSKHIRPTTAYVLSGKIPRVVHAYELVGDYQVQFTCIARDIFELEDLLLPAVEAIPHVLDIKHTQVMRITEEWGFIPPREEFLYDNASNGGNTPLEKYKNVLKELDRIQSERADRIRPEDYIFREES